MAWTTARSVLAGLAVCAGSAVSLGAMHGGEMGRSAVQPEGAGSSFDTADLGVETIDGLITMVAEAGWVWREGGTNRVVLDRDVEMEIGGSMLRARRADLWLRDAGDGVYQVFGVFEKLTSSDGSFSGERVPVRAMVRLQDSISMRVGARMDERPVREDLVEFMGRSMAVYERRVLGIDRDQKDERAAAQRWAPKEMGGESVVRAEPARSLPVPTGKRAVSRVERALARARSGQGERGRVEDGEERVAGGDARPGAQATAPAGTRSSTQPNTQPNTQTNNQANTQPNGAPGGVAGANEAVARVSGSEAGPTPDLTTGAMTDEAAGEEVIAGRDEGSPIFQASGIFSIAIDGKVVVQGARKGVEGEADRSATITAEGGVRMQYQDPASRQTMDLEAERAVIFLRGDGETGVGAPSQINASEIEGMYLEGGVFAGNADWSVRSPKVYVDLVHDKMLMLDAVFWTVDERTSMPLYLRAESVRQTSLGEFEAKKARIANSAFFEPDLSIGVSELKVSVRDERPKQRGLLGLVGSVGDGVGSLVGEDGSDGGSAEAGSDLVRRVFVDGKNVTLRLGSVPILWVPRVKGEADAFPLKQVEVGDSNRAGFAVRTRWDAYSLFGVDPIPGIKTSLQLDYYTERGVAFGLNSSWDTDRHRGGLRSYIVPDDNGTDIAASGRDIVRKGETRGMISVNDIWRLDEPWTLVTKGTYLSDEVYISAFEERLGRETPDFDSMLRLERTDERSQFALELSGSPNDFFAAEHLLQSPGYAVDKLPEASFVSVSNDLFAETMPGVFEYQYEASFGAMRLRLSEPTAAEYGFNTPSLAAATFGTLPGESLADVQRLLGFDEDNVSRFDTRHEVSARFDAGALRLTPFAVGRFTAYDTSFDTLTPAQTDNVRYWGAVGMTVSTTLTRVDDSANSDFFDVHRIRHIVEPSVTVWQADSGFAVGDTPIFDDDVEGLLRGTMIRAAVDQTWQTKRGGPGRWRDADILKINAEYVWASDRAGTSVIPDYFSARPELSNPGTYVGTDVVFSPTDVLAFSGSLVYDLDLDQAARTSTGVIVEHRPGFTSAMEYRDIRALDASFLTGRVNYTLTDKYSVSTSANYNFDKGDFQNFYARVERKFQVGTLAVSVNYDNIRSETSIGVVFRPFGTSGVGAGAGSDFFSE